MLKGLSTSMAAMSGLVGFVAVLDAATITFEQEPPYAATVFITGKADPVVNATWGGGLLATVGFEGPGASPTARFLQMPATASAASLRITPNPSAFGLGGTVLPATGTYAFNFDLRRGSDSAATSTNVAATVQIGRDSTDKRALIINFRTDGQLQFLDGTTGIAVTTDGAIPTGTNRLDLDNIAAGAWVNVSGVLDYTSKTYTLKVNGVTQVNLSGNSTLAFRNQIDTFADFGRIWMETFNVADYRALQVDNISLAIPEPASLSMLGLSALLILRRRTTDVR